MSENKKNLFISIENDVPLRPVNESTDPQNKDNKYIFTGCFTQCSSKKPGGRIIKNRNQRIYFDEEVLRHLGYLRDQIKENGFLVGELDHPDRFEVKLSEGSHKITDLWYDEPSQRVMGRLELLDTPKGMIARQLVDAGLKLAVSSRSAGSVRNDSSVELDMMYTWDIVFTPGFEEAHLERVNESLNASAKNYLNESLNAANTNKETEIYEFSKKAQKINEDNKKHLEKPIDFAELCKPLTESSEEEKKNECKEEKKDSVAGLPEANLDPLAEDEDKKEENKEEKSSSEDKQEDKDSSSDDDKEEKKDDSKEDKKEDKENNLPELSDEEKEERRNKIVSVTIIGNDNEEISSEDDDKEDNDKEKIVDIEAITDDSDDEKKEESDENKEETNESEDNDDDDWDPTKVENKEHNASQDDFDKKVLNDCEEKVEKVKKETEKDMSAIKDLLAKVKQKNEVREAIYRYYPFAISLSEDNFKQFAALKVDQKNKVQKFIIENNIFTVRDINENWKTPLLVEKRSLKNWIRLASEEDRRLYLQAPMEVQDAIEESAKYVVFQTKADVDAFWEKTGLRKMESDRIMNERLKDRYSIQTVNEAKEANLDVEDCKALGYGQNFFQMLEDSYDK